MRRHSNRTPAPPEVALRAIRQMLRNDLEHLPERPDRERLPVLRVEEIGRAAPAAVVLNVVVDGDRERLGDRNLPNSEVVLQSRWCAAWIRSLIPVGAHIHPEALPTSAQVELVSH